jgi:hypothetical protein
MQATSWRRCCPTAVPDLQHACLELVSPALLLAWAQPPLLTATALCAARQGLALAGHNGSLTLAWPGQVNCRLRAIIERASANSNEAYVG